MRRWAIKLVRRALTLGEAHRLHHRRPVDCTDRCWRKPCGCHWHQHGDHSSAGHGRRCFKHQKEGMTV